MNATEESDENSVSLAKDMKSKRRSSIFNRQSMGNLDHEIETSDSEEISHESKKIKLAESNKASFDLRKYIDSLKEEKKQWKKEYAKRKTQVKELSKSSQNQETSATLDLSCLSDSERAFLAARPDYEEFNRNVFQLHALATKVTYLNSLAESLFEKSIMKMQSDVKNATQRVIKLAD
ncbi:hypothetical protein QAD02_016633 [Eretmocerus hayati]|uniref:Uncharacterized protein n=1 Tax=Eretmocerus hayati TaxID=131215 RepID=A0ACC2PDF7_9HYME|nr:hypothetical protein QAD02_016633 [Eretmocerus hayati]